MRPHRFTLEEAQVLLPRLTGMLQGLQTLKTQHDVLQAKASELGTKMKGNGRLLDQELKQTQEGMEKAAGAINEVVAKVNELGCEVKDLDMGLVDFRAEHEGREVYLCWKLGEERISWWHDLDSGFASRRPLD